MSHLKNYVTKTTHEYNIFNHYIISCRKKKKKKKKRDFRSLIFLT